MSLVDSLLDSVDLVELLSDLTGQCASLLDVASAGLTLARTLTHVASVAMLQGQAPAPEAVTPGVRNALNRQLVVEQAKGFVRAELDVTVDEALVLLRSHARAHGLHLSDLCRELLSDRSSRATVVADLRALVPTV